MTTTRRLLATLLGLLVLLAGLAGRFLPAAGPQAADSSPATSTSIPLGPSSARTAGPADDDGKDRVRPSLGDARLDRQVLAVIESFERTGRPPAGVAQGGQRGGPPGQFANAEGRLPAHPPGYYTESDVWPRGNHGRGAERLVFGRGGEVFYSRDHYRSFERVR
jgi:guanyl-specific ribonuclease Sa